MNPDETPPLPSLIGAAITAKTGDLHAGRREVAHAVIEALQLARQVCPSCGAEAFAAADVALLCGVCHVALQAPVSEDERIQRFITRHAKTLKGLADT